MVDARWFTEPSKRPRVFFCRRPRFNWMSLLRRALLSGLRVRSSARPYFPPERSLSLSLSLSLTRAHVRAHAHTHTHIGRSFRSADPILYLLYRGDQSRRIPRACAARNERSPVLSVFPSVCPEDRSPSIPPTRSPLVPLLGSPSASTSSSSFLLALLAAFLRSLLGSLAVRSRDCRPGQIRPHLDTHAPRGAPFAPFLRDSFNDRHDRSPLILLSARSGSSMNEDGSAV